MSLLKIANEVEEIEQQLAEEAAAQNTRNRGAWAAGGAALGGAGGALGGGALGAGLGAATGLVGAGIGQGKRLLGRGPASVGKQQVKQLAKGFGVGGALGGLGAGGLTGALAGRGASYIPDGIDHVVENREAIADRASQLGRSALEHGQNAVDYIRQ